jgi:peptidoglycan-associated lipoprotein
MRRTSFVVPGMLAMGALLAGCPPKYPHCKSDDECKEHQELCVEGRCRECATDANCKPGFACQEHRCIPKPECAKDADCGQGKGCEGGKCVAHECEADKDCPAAAKCLMHHCVAGSCASNDDCPSGQECQSGTCVAKQDKCNYDAVHFDFNESSLTSETQSRLKDVAECLKAQTLSVTLEGHADERGTEEYNLQLSQKRAASVKKYVVALGVPAKKLKTVGYGKDRPAVDGHDEAAWAANRRVEFNRK